MSILYVTIADIRALKLQTTKINGILNILSSRWDYKSSNIIYYFLYNLVYPPYIEGIANYFPYSIMKKPKEANKKN